MASREHEGIVARLAATLHRLRHSAPVNRLRYRFYLAALAFPRCRVCNLCGWRGSSFLSYLHKRVLCPRCGSQVRHRLIGAALVYAPERTQGLRLDGARVLHATPEYCLERLLRPRAARYVTTSFPGDTARTSLRGDLTRLPFAARTFDVVVASDVLEHIPDDRSALAEVWRVLDTGGVAILTVPTYDGDERTYEDPRIVAPAERERAFGQPDHVRNYGIDVVDRIAAAGFDVSMVSAESFDADQVRRHVLTPPVPLSWPLGWNRRRVFFARK
jgi:SAM-dependent methyltransferase